MRITAIDHVVLPVDDAEAAIRFYVEVLGLEGVRLEAFRQGRAGFASVRVGDALLDLMPSEGAARLDHVCLRVLAPIDEVAANLRAAGVAILQGPVARYGAQGDGMSVYVRDPAGNTLELKSAAGV
jgi:catechol 2,3-dioxygenase-like lactoylglutathione lyase family enzyme